MNQSVLVVAAHPDDEALGCGGTLARLSDEGHAVHVVFMTDGVAARSSGSPVESKQRRAMARRASKFLGIQSIHFEDFPDNRMDSIDLLEVVKVVEDQLMAIQPQLVITHHHGDLNVDHRLVHQAVMTACRPPTASSVRRIWCFEVPSSTEWQVPVSARAFLPNLFFDISEVFSRKIEALGAYAEEMRPWPHSRAPEAVEHLARWRGASVGVDAAEAFMVARELI